MAVTRPRAQARPLVEGLERLGAEASVVPLIAVEPLQDVPARLDADHDWVVFTSVNAVGAVGRRLRLAAGTRVAAVGPATAEALLALGVEPTFVPDRFAADAIADGLGRLDEARVLLPQSEIAEPALAAALRARGATVDTVVAYRTVALRPSEEDLRELERVDAVLLASGSAARSLAAAASPLGRALVVCIGPATAEAARAAGLRADLVAREATGEGMIRALVSHYRESA